MFSWRQMHTSPFSRWQLFVFQLFAQMKRLVWYGRKDGMSLEVQTFQSVALESRVLTS